MKQTNDYELVFLAQQGNEDAINLIYDKYKPIIIKKSKNTIVFVTHHGVDINDIMQEGFIGLDKAIKGYNQEQEASFYTFAMLCIDRQIANYVRRITNSKDKVLNEAISIDDSLERIIDDGTDIEKNLIGKDLDSNFVCSVRKSLTTFERKVFDMRMNDHTIEEIANKLNKDIKSIYNTVQRIKFKIKKNMKIDY